MDKNMTIDDYSYTSDDIQVLEGLEAVRKDLNVHCDNIIKRFAHLVWEIVDNAIDEALVAMLIK